MVADIDPHVIGIMESWANKDIVDVELVLTGYVMFRKDRRERRGGGVILNILKDLSKHMKYHRKVKQIVRKQFGVT